MTSDILTIEKTNAANAEYIAAQEIRWNNTIQTLRD